MRNYICPHCFRNVNPYDFRYYCFNHDDYFNYEIPDWRKAFRQNEYTLKNIPLIFPANKPRLRAIQEHYQNNVLRNVYCPDCGSRNQVKRICPECGEEFYYKLLGEQNRMISVAGPSGSGKTVYLGVLINELKNNDFLRNKNYSFEAIGQMTTEVYRDYFYEPLYGDQVLPRKNTTLSTGNYDQSAQKPMIYQVKKVNSPSNLILTFFDSPGEDVEDMDEARKHLRYIHNSQGLLLFMDISDKDSLMMSIQTLDNVVQMYRESLAITTNAKIPIRLALVFGKCDKMRKQLGPLCENVQKIPPPEALEQVSMTFENYLANNGYKQIINTIKNNFKNYKYFPVSSLGFEPNNPPDISNHKINPIMVEYPIAWMLYQFG